MSDLRLDTDPFLIFAVRDLIARGASEQQARDAVAGYLIEHDRA